jgi:flagellar basal-body rod protein FlgC
MSMNDVFRIASSALTAQSLRLNTTASNMANAESVAGPDGQVYKAKQVVFQTNQIGDRPESAGVSVARVAEDDKAPRRAYDPKSPSADADGYVNMPNVNVVDEMVNMISASRSYQTNVEVMNTAKTLMLKALTLGN